MNKQTHTHTHNSQPFVRAADSCNGHSDKGHRYHYHGLPRCLFKDLQIPSPNNKTRYWNHWDTLSVDEQIDLWPSTTTKGSPLVGYALDGFPIYGPYNATGHLQIGVSSSTRATLNECNFDVATQRYHMTPNPPYLIGCYMASKGIFVLSLSHTHTILNY